MPPLRYSIRPASLLFCLLMFLSGILYADDAAELRGWIIESIKAGQRPAVFVDLLGTTMRAKVVSADDTGITVDALGVKTDVAWQDLSPNRFFALAARIAGDRSPSDKVSLVRFARCSGLDAQAGELEAELLRADPSVQDLLNPPELSDPKVSLAPSPETGPPPATDTASPVTAPVSSAPASSVAGLGRYAPIGAAAIPADHPRLFFRKKSLKDVRSAARALQEARSGFRGGFTSRYRDDNPAMLALKYLLSNDDAAARRAVSLMKTQGVNDWYHAGEWVSQSALAYDWLYDYPGFSDKDKKEAEDAIVSGMNTCVRWVAGKDGHFIWNGHWICMAGAVTGTVALYGHRQEATANAERVLRTCDESLLALDYIDGAWPEGPTYAFHTLHDMIVAVEAFWSATGENPYKRHPGLARFSHWFMWMTRPDWSLERWDDASGGSSCNSDHEYAGYILPIARGAADPAASMYAKSLMAKWGARSFSPEYQGHYLSLWGFPEITEPIARYPAALSDCFGRNVAGHVIARSGWGPDDSMLAFRAGQNICPGHQHYCANAFTYYHKAPLAIDSGQYMGNPLADYMKNYTQHSVAHNLVVFPRTGKPDDDGGQTMEFHHVLTSSRDLVDPGSWNVASIFAYEEKGSYMYVGADATRAYGGKCRLFVRELVYLRPNKIVILDRTVPADGRTPTWLLHSVGEPLLTRNQFIVQNEGMRLAGTFVLPQEITLAAVGGPGREFWNVGRNWPPPSQPLRFHQPGAWRIEASPVSPQANWFLVAMDSAPKSAPPPPVSPVMDDPAFIGLSIAGRTVLFQKDRPGVVKVR
ncbi:MAG: hypothetical protein JW909_01260 [Planctomycetes bacterium]|nr:hypothetical protein [Planctomycetota bacterium]